MNPGPYCWPDAPTEGCSPSFSLQWLMGIHRLNNFLGLATIIIFFSLYPRLPLLLIGETIFFSNLICLGRTLKGFSKPTQQPSRGPSISPPT